MDEKQMQYFKDILSRQLEALLAQSGILVTELVTHNGREIEYLDRASFDIDQTIKIRIRSRERLLMKKIQAALSRIEDHTYGICEICGEDISIKRLEARPVTTKCITCKTEEEKVELLVS